MFKVNDVLAFLETVAPKSMMMDWDNCGLLCGTHSQAVTRILVALDACEAVFEEAVEIGADLVVTHHPLIFNQQRTVTDETAVGRGILLLVKNEISTINAHTNLDCAPGGVNDVLAQRLGLQNIRVLSPLGTDTNGRPWGLLRCGTVEECTLPDFMCHVKAALGCPVVHYCDSGKPVKLVAVGGGSCADELMVAVAAGCDTFVTSDIRYKDYRLAVEVGINLIDAGHFYTENPVCAYLADVLREAFPEIPVSISQNHTDCSKFF